MIVKDLKQELFDILPSLTDYANAKNDFADKKVSQLMVNEKLEKLVVEVNEFIVLLHSYATDKSETEILNRIKV